MAQNSATGPQVSVHGSTGVIGGPSSESPQNTLEAESYSSSTTTSPLVSSTLPSLLYENTPSNSEGYSSGHSSASSTSTYSDSSDEGSDDYGKHSFPEASNAGTNKVYSIEKSVSSELNGVNYSDSGTGNVGSVGREFQSQAQKLNTQSLYSSASGIDEIGSLVFNESTSNGKYVASSPHTYSGSEASYSSDSREVQAPSGAALDAARTKLLRKLSETPPSFQNTRVSATLVAEGGNRYKENEIGIELKQNYVPSTTRRPLKPILKPIVVPEIGGTPSSLALFTATRPPTAQRSRQLKVGKLYHREARPDSPLRFSTSSSTLSPKKVMFKDYPPTPAPSVASARGNPRLKPHELISSGRILAPIQAAVTVSTSQHPDLGRNKIIPSSEFDIEKQVIRKEAVYKTTIDVQKSIPFEIHHDEGSHLNNEDTRNHEHDDNSSQHIEGGYGSNDDGDVVYKGSSEEENSGEIGTPQKLSPSTPYNENIRDNEVGYDYQQTSNEDYHQSHNSYNYIQPNPVSSPNPHSGYSGFRENVDPNGYNQNHFLQQAITAYQNMGDKYETHQARYPANMNLPSHPLFIPNQFYYVYLPRFNPHVHRYASQGPVYDSYRPPAPGYLRYPGDHALGQFVYQGSDNPGYSAIVDHEARVPQSGENTSGSDEEGSHENYSDTSGNDVHQSPNNPKNSIAQYYKTTGLVGAQKPNHFPDNHVAAPLSPAGRTKLAPQSALPQPGPVDYTNIATLSVIPYSPKLVLPSITYSRPVSFPYSLPHTGGASVSQLNSKAVAPQLTTNNFRPVYLYRKATQERLLHRDAPSLKHAAFRPSHPVFTSQYPPQTYQVTRYIRGSDARHRANARKLRIEYGGFKPPLVPSTLVEEEPKPVEGPPSEDTKSP